VNLRKDHLQQNELLTNDEQKCFELKERTKTKKG